MSSEITPRPPVVTLSDAAMAELPSLVAAATPDVTTLLEWSHGVDRTALPKRAEHAWLYGTPQWEALNEAQRHELLWLENAQTASDFVWLKEGLSQLFGRLMERFGARVPEPIREAMTAVMRQQAPYAAMFRRYLDEAGLPLFARPEFMEFIAAMERNHPIAGLLCTYAMETILLESVRLEAAPHGDALTRALYAVNAAGSVNHLALCRALCENAVANATMHETKVRMGYLLRGYMKVVMQRFTFNPAIADCTSFDLAIDAEEAGTIQRSPNNVRINEQRCAPVVTWTKELGIVSNRYQWSSLDQGALPLAHFARQKKRPAPHAAAMESAK